MRTQRQWSTEVNFHPTLARNFDVSEPLEWIARITSHIPRKGAKQVIYYGAYSQAWRGRERRQGILQQAPGEENYASSMKDRPTCSRRRRQMWAVLLKKVWDVDVLKCPNPDSSQILYCSDVYTCIILTHPSSTYCQVRLRSLRSQASYPQPSTALRNEYL